MKANELRIWNLVNYMGKVSPVLAIDGQREYTNKRTREQYKSAITIGEYNDDGIIWNINVRWLKHIKPITLTEQWLIDFGFKENNDFGNWHLNDYKIFSLEGFNLGLKDGSVYWYNGASDDYYSSTLKLPFVHSLQNLCFSLTEQELKLKTLNN